MRSKGNFSFRVFLIISLFALFCLIFAVRMINICATSERDIIVTDTYERREPILALRGEIFDRNGKKLVGNVYSYNLVLDYDAMAITQVLRSRDILTLLDALDQFGLSTASDGSSFPFVGSYPNFTYSAEARDPNSDVYRKLLKRIAENELETNSGVPKNELTVSHLTEFYAAHPEEFPSENEIIDWYLQRYRMLPDKKGDAPIFSDTELDRLIRIRYDMEANDFSIYTRYVVAKGVDENFIAYIEELSIPGAEFERIAEREYLYPGYASHILGQLGSIPAESWEEYKAEGYDMSDKVGISGCEFAFEEHLRGINGVKVIVEDKQGNIIDSYIETEAKAGSDVYLTIDIDLQIAAEKGLRENVSYFSDADAGGVTAIDPKSGEILVLASYPTYDLTTFNKDYNNLASDSLRPLRNRALSAYTPGSVFKVGMVAAGITEGTVTGSTIFMCDGADPVYGNKCWIHPGRHGEVDADYALQVSCNCYFYELGPKLGIQKMNYYCSRFGLGVPTGIEIREEVGILAGPEHSDQYGKQWREVDTVMAAIGQSDNMFNPLQISGYISTILNGGKRYSAHLLKEVRAFNGEVLLSTEAVTLDTVQLSDSATSAVKRGMKQMIQYDSVASYYMSSLPVTVGGKTGTAQRGEGKNDNRFFVCAAPYNDPEIVISVIIEPTDDQPKDNAHGSSFACIAAARVLEEFYN